MSTWGGAIGVIYGPTSGVCPTLNVRDVDTVLTTSGAVTGTFAGTPDGTVVAVNCSFGTPATLRMNYTANAVTATVETSGSSGGTPTTTTLSSSSSSLVTN